MVDLKYVLDKSEDLVFYLYHSLGYSTVYMNVYSEKNPRIPTDDEADFFLTDVQSIISFNEIEKVLEDEEMSEHSNKYLYIIAQGFVNSKLSIEYDLKEEDD